MTWSIEIPGDPPSWNHSYTIGWIRGHPTLVKASHVGRWQSLVAALVRQHRPRTFTPGRRVRIVVHWRTKRARDCDAGLKALLDAIAVGLDCNDRIFLVTVASNEVDRANPRTLVSIANEDGDRDIE